MADSDIPTEALEAAERVLASLDPERDAGSVRRLVHNLLTAAAPHLIAEGRRQALAAIRRYLPPTYAEWATEVVEGLDHG